MPDFELGSHALTCQGNCFRCGERLFFAKATGLLDALIPSQPDRAHSASTGFLLRACSHHLIYQHRATVQSGEAYAQFHRAPSLPQFQITKTLNYGPAQTTQTRHAQRNTCIHFRSAPVTRSVFNGSLFSCSACTLNQSFAARRIYEVVF